MTLSPADVKKIAYLARLDMSEKDIAYYQPQLSHILQFVEQMDKADTSSIEPMAHALNIPQRLRPDTVTEVNQRDEFQKIAPQTEAGLYLVPQVIEE